MKKVFLRASVALCLCSSIQLAFGYLPAPSDPNALPVTVSVYEYLASRKDQSSNKMIMGQHLGGISEIQDTTAPYEFDIDNHVIDGKLPGMVGTRYDAPNKELPGNPYTLTSAFCTQLNDELINIWNAHQPIIHITGIPPNPWNWASGRDPYLSTNDIDDLWLSAPSSAAKTSFWSSIDIIAGALQELEDAGIPVVFRPFAEFNQTNKYYFANQTGADFITLWQDVYDYYVGVKGLHNLLFCWEVWALNRNANSSNIGPWYPGDSYVDIVAGAYYFAPESDIDYLDNTTGLFSFNNSDPEDQIVYNYLIARNRPFGAAQFGLNQGHGPTPGDHNFTLKFMDYATTMAFAYYWKGYQEVQLQANAVNFVNEIRVATANDLPNFSSNPVTTTFTSVSSHDGYVFESNETSNVGGTANSTGTGTSALRTGDTVSDQQYKTFVSFDTSSIPDGATITAVTLRLKRGALTGQNPFATHSTCRVDIVGGSGFGGALALATGDFQASAGATQVAAMSDPVSNGSWSTGALNATGMGVVNKTGHTQLRVYFATDDNDDSGNDYIGWYSGEAATGNKPELVVTYQ